MKRTLLFTAIGGAFITLGLAGCLDSDNNDSSTVNDEQASVQLKSASNESELKSYLTASFTRVNSGSQYYDDVLEMADDATASPTVEADANTSDVASEPAEEFSGTNVQVQGVDESDVWKYDGENFYVLKPAVWKWVYDESDDCYDVIYSEEQFAPNTANFIAPRATDPVGLPYCEGHQEQVSPAQVRVVKNTQETISSIELNNIYANDIYLNDDSLIVMGTRQSNSSDSTAFTHWQQGRSDIRVMDVSNPAEPSQTHQIYMDGYVVQSRRIGDELILVSRFTPYFNDVISYPTTESQASANAQKLEDVNLADLMPNITINGTKQALVNAEDCWITDAPADRWGYPSLATITRLNTETGTFTSRCLAGEVQGIYMSTENIYLHNTIYWDYPAETEPAGTSISAIWNWNEGSTHVHKFSLDASFAYQGSAKVKGELGWNHQSFRLGELSDGSLGLVTHSGEWDEPDNFLTILKSADGQFSQIAQLPNAEQPAEIGKPGERIYSVRFMQNRAYIVTFSKVDPLYVVDLADPSKPYLAGELEIPGYSDYLHPIGSNLLLGVGKDAIQGASGTTWYQGIKVALFDVADMSNPTELSNVQIGKRGSNTALQWDHHAFAGIQQEDAYRFVIPMSVNDGETSDNYYRDPESQFYKWSYSGLHLFEVKDNQLNLSGVMKTDVASENSHSWGSWNTRRGLIQGEDVYHLSGTDLYHAKWNTPDELSDPF